MSDPTDPTPAPHPDAVEASQAPEPSEDELVVADDAGEGYEPGTEVVDGPIDADASGNEAYAGIDPMYANHANATEAPYAAEGDGEEAERERRLSDLSAEMDARPKPGVTGFTS